MSFEWPWQYEFPPFFTLQKNSNILKKQLDAWCTLILDYCKSKNIHSLTLKDVARTELFMNKKIDRKLTVESVKVIFEELQKRGHVEWQDKAHQQCLLMWKTPETWARLIYSWAINRGMTNTVCTLFELTQGEDTSSEEFYQMEDWLLLHALKFLEKQHKAELIGSPPNYEGVKFF